MIDFNKIPTNEDWGNIVLGEYYQNNEYIDYINKTYKQIIESINNKPEGTEIILSLGMIGPVVPFYFYSMCILHAIKKQEIILSKKFNLYYFDYLLASVEGKILNHVVFDKVFSEFISPLKEILSGILDGSLPSDYDEEELAEVEERGLALIAEIERRYAECIAAEKAAAAFIPDKEV